MNNPDSSISNFYGLKGKIRAYLATHYIVMNIVAFVFAFISYFSCYCFRKPWTFNKYEGVEFLHMDFKTLLVICQTLGYTFSKLFGIIFTSRLNPEKAARNLIYFILLAELTLILFGAIPKPYNCFMLFFNGLPIGMCWGLIFTYLDGRRTSELLSCAMCVSTIISAGAARSIGGYIVTLVGEDWMPAVVGALFFPVLCVSIFIIQCLPPPSQEDIIARTDRVAMTNKDRIAFMKNFAPGLFLMYFYYVFLASYRDVRDNFSVELWSEIGYKNSPSILTTAELIVAIVVIFPVAGIMMIKNNIIGLLGYHALIIIASIGFGVMTLFYKLNHINPTIWMVSAGVACYLAHVPFQSIIFDRQIAAFKYKANSNFVFYVADFLGYIASVAIHFVKNFGAGSKSMLQFFEYISILVSFGGAVVLTLSGIYYYFKWRKDVKNAPPTEEDNSQECSSNSEENKLKEENITEL